MVLIYDGAIDNMPCANEHAYEMNAHEKHQFEPLAIAEIASALLVVTKNRQLFNFMRKI